MGIEDDVRTAGHPDVVVGHGLVVEDLEDLEIAGAGVEELGTAIAL